MSNMKELENKTMSENSFLPFEAVGVQTLTLAQLERTKKENDAYNKPIMGIYHSDLLGRALDICQQGGYTAEVYDLFAAQNRDRTSPGVSILPELERMYGERAIEAHILRRVYANIRLTDMDDEEHTTNLAIAFHQRGIQVGFGNMVKICHNQCMLGAGQFASTYSDKGKKNQKFSVEQILDCIKSWIADARRIVVEEREKIRRMKAIIVSPEQVFTVIGMLISLRVACDTSDKRIRINRTYPLNSSQINRYTEKLMQQQFEAGQITAWDLYNCATDLYKANSMDIPTMLPQNLSMAEFIDEHFSL